MTNKTLYSTDLAPSVASNATSENPHFAAMGGAEPIARLAERFYYYLETLPEARAIRAMHAADLSEMKGVLARYLTEWMGGPALYSSERGHPRLRRRHQRFEIGPSARDAWMLCMRSALSDVVTDAALRNELDAAFFKVADFVRNDAEHVHVHHADPLPSPAAPPKPNAAPAPSDPMQPSMDQALVTQVGKQS